MHRNVFLSVLAALGLVVGTVLAPVAMPVAHASPCGVLIKGSDWLQGQGVDVKGNCITPHGYDFYNYDVQCVELPQMRIYGPKGKFGWPAIYGLDNKAARIPEGSPGLIRYNPGSGYVPVPGDLIIEHEHRVNAYYGHVAVVDRVEGNNIYAVEQNGSVNGWHTYYYNGSQYKGGYAPVKAILHAPQNQFKNGSSAPQKQHNPKGAFEEISAVGSGTFNVKGWTYDPDATDQDVKVEVWVGGDWFEHGVEGPTFLTANKPWHNGFPDGFDGNVTTSRTGDQRVCVRAVNLGEGENILLGCKNVTISGNNPVGGFDSVSSPDPHTVKVSGWAHDDDDREHNVGVHVYVGGEWNSPGVDGPHTVWSDKMSPAGVKDMFEDTIPTTKRGRQKVCLYAINLGGGQNSDLGCRDVDIMPAKPFITGFEITSPATGEVEIAGKAYNPDNESRPFPVHVYVGDIAAGDLDERVYETTDTHDEALGKAEMAYRFTTEKKGKQEVCVYVGADLFDDYAVNAGCETLDLGGLPPKPTSRPKPAPAKPAKPAKPTSKKPTPAKPAKPAKPTTKKPTPAKPAKPAKPTTKKPTNPAPAPAPAPAPSGKESGSSPDIMWIVLLLVAVLGAAGAALQNMPGGLPGMPKL